MFVPFAPAVAAATAVAAAVAALSVVIIQPAAGAPRASAAPIAKPEPALTVLENGLRVIVVERRSAARLVALDLRVRAGTAYETPENNGVAHFLEHLLFKGTATRKPGEIDALVEQSGGELTAATGKDWAQFAATIPTPGWKTVLEALADAVRNPALRSDDIEAERNVLLAEWHTAMSEAARVPYTMLAEAAFPPGHPYRLSLYGPESNVRRLNRDDLLAFWRAHYIPSRMTLVIVGDVSRDAAVDAARAAFGGAAAAAGPPEPPAGAVPPAEDRPRNGVARAAPVVLDRRLVTTVIGFPAPSVRMAEDAVAMDVLLRILAGGGRGRLADRLVRQDRIALAVGADYLTQRAPGLFLLTAIGRPDADPKRLEDALLAEVRRLVEDGVSHDEVEDAKSATAGQILFDEETFAGQASQLAFYDAIDPVDGYRFAVLYPGRVRAVRADDLLRVARRYLAPNRYAVATVLPLRPPVPEASTPAAGR